MIFSNAFFRIFSLLALVETGIVKFMLGENLTSAEICPQNLGGTERQLRNSDLSMTYWVKIRYSIYEMRLFYGFLYVHRLCWPDSVHRL